MYTYQDIVLGITTFNRRRMVEWQGRSLKLCSGIGEANIVVVDDQSTEFTLRDLQGIYPSHASVIRRSEASGGADYAFGMILRHLVDLDCEIIVILDSDLLCSAIMLDEILRLMHKAPGIFSLFNTPSHSDTADFDEFVIKRSIGSAGWVMSKDLAVRLLDAVSIGPRFDWRCCEFLTASNIPLISVKHSLVQHAGFAFGQFSNVRSGDFGVGFLDNSPVNSAGLNESIVFAMQAGFSDLFMRFEAARREIIALKTELAAHRTKLGL